MPERKVLLWLLFLSFVPFQMKAQAFTGGLLGGLSVNQIDGDEYAGYDKAGIVFGGWVRTNTTGPFQVQGEIRYFGKGAGNRANPDQPDRYYRVRLRYIEVPVLLRYTVSSRIPLGLGLSAGYLAEAKEDLTGDGYIDPVRKFRRLELAGQATAGYDFSSHITGEIRFSYSLIPVRDHPGGQTFLGNLGQYNNNLSFCILYMLGGRR
ncbi:MAG: PorT family protein [Bacteroidales bacterium]|nr:PorT family protein [Bacteroidales bacterium]